MSFNVARATSVTVTKLSSSGNFLMVFSDGSGPTGNSLGQVRFVFSVPSADMATFAALTSGNSSTKNYAQDLNQGDYPAATFVEV